MSRVVLLLLIHSLLFGFGMTSDYEAARKQAQKEHKILLVLLVKHSDKIKINDTVVTIVQDKKTSDLIDKHAIFVLLYQDTTQSYPIEMLYTDITPTLFFLGSDELFICKALRGTLELEKIQNCLLK